MAQASLHALLRQIRGLVEPAVGAAPCDRVLLERFSLTRDEAAFTELVERHGPMILAICRRILGSTSDADDAFQATFCALARQAPRTSWHDSLAGWLHVVASRIARKVRARAQVRRQHEQQAAAMHRETQSPALPDHELREHIDAALEGLPEKYRAPLVLCYLQGLTNEEAARQLGWPKGSVQGRLARGRDMLRKRLVRRGLALSAGTLPLLIPANASASVPPALHTNTIRTAIQFAAGHPGVSSPVAALAEGVLRTMWMKKMQTIAVVLACIGLLVGVGVWSQRSSNDAAAAPLPADSNNTGNHKVLSFSGGIADQDAKVIYVMNVDSGIDALEPATGKLLWRTPKGPTYWPMAAVGNKLVARTRPEGKENEFAIALLDCQAEGKLLLKSEPLAFPAGSYPWFDSKVIGGARPVVQTTHLLRVSESVVDNELRIDWQARTTTTGGFREPQPDKTIDAASLFRIDLKTGKITREEKKPPADINGKPDMIGFALGDIHFKIEDTIGDQGRGPLQVHKRSLKATTKTGKLLWEHPLKGYSIGFAP
ncbi:MAG: RNA polymerase sigma factor [Gemmataceae bacterium]